MSPLWGTSLLSENLLELRNVSKVFRIGGLVFGTRLVAVDDVSLSLPADQPSILSIVGESGSGKTTLARIILELEHPTSGDVLIEGHPLFEKGGAGLKGERLLPRRTADLPESL